MADFVVLASGSGSNFEAIAQHVGTPHRLLALIVDNPQAFALVRAEEMGIPSVLVNYRPGRSGGEKRLRGVLDELQPDLIVLAGFMKVLPSSIVDQFPQRIMNIHPSLLPDYPGLQAIERSFADREARMGITIHLVDRGVDTGPVIAQFPAERAGAQTIEQMEERIHALEHTHYPRLVAETLDALDRDARRPLEAAR